MRQSSFIGYLAGCAGVFALGVALAKEPAQAPVRASSTPAGCTDSARGRAHVLRICGDQHYWIKTGATPYPYAPGTGYLFYWVAADHRAPNSQ